MQSEVSGLIKEFYKLIKTQFGTSIEVFRTDNGSKFVNADLK